MPAPTRRRRAGTRASIRHTRRSNSMRRSSSGPGRYPSSKPSPASTRRISTACRETEARSPCARRPGRCRARSRSARRRSCRCERANPSDGGSPDGTAELRMPALDAPIFTALTPLLGRLPRDRLPRHDELNALTVPEGVSGGGAPIRFVPPAAPSREFSAQYEVRIFETGEVQTRPDDWHDLFNALVWLAFPRTKAVLNRHHCEEIRARRGERLRGTARDVLTLFDEGGIVVAAAAPELPALLREFRWKELFWRRRAEVLRSMRFYVFGHAIYEKALEPYKGVTAKALIVGAAPGLLEAPLAPQLAELDARAADYFSGTQALASTRNLSPLPILGIPGWEPANASEEYYDDPSQFRPRRSP